MSTAKLYVLCKLSADWHSGQWSRGYRIGCRASKRLRRIGIRDPLDQWEKRRQWRASFRSEVARYLNRWRGLRHTL